MLMFSACCKSTNIEKTAETNVIDMHNAQNSLDWSGTYIGNLPCANYENLKTVLTLNEDLTYSLKRNIGIDDSFFINEGSFIWTSGNIVKLENINRNEMPSMYRVEENQLRQLDLKGNRIVGKLADRYVLIKKKESAF